MHRAVLFILFLFCYNFIFAQEFNIQVSVQAPRLKVADESVLKTLEAEIKEFYNNRKWTDDDFEEEERIEGTIQINISEDLSATSFDATVLVSTSRPVFNSNYTTVLLNHIDRNFKFNYEQNTPLRDNSVAFTDNLSAMLTFYAYVMLGYDYDSFSPMGGDKYFKIAQNLIGSIPTNIAQGGFGWSASEGSRNKYWLIENALNPRFTPYRQAYYKYHRKGLDMMADNAVVGKANILDALKSMDRVNRSFRNSMIMQMFSNSKNTEILEIYKNSLKPEQRTVYNIMSTIDPAQSEVIAELK